MHHKLYIFLILLIFGTCYPSCAQVKNIGLPKIINYKKNNYSGGSQNWDIGQDKAGNMYFANTAGLIQYNGTSWTKNGMPYGTVRSLKVCNDRKIYVGGYNEFGYFEADKNGKLQYHSLLGLIPPGSKKIIDFVWKTHSIGNTVFFQTFFGIYAYTGGRLKIIDAPNRFKFSFTVNNTLYVQDINLGLLKYINGKLIPLPGTKTLNKTEVWGILPFEGDKLMVITNDKGIYIYDKALYSWSGAANDFALKNNSLGGRLIGKNNIVLNSVQDGVIICDTKGNIVQHISDKNGLQNSTILSSFIDKNNNLWLGLDNGITYLNENSPFTYLGSTFGFSTVYSSALHNGNLYVATNKGLFSHPWKEPFKEESFTFIKGTTGQVWDIQSIDGTLFCSHNGGLFIIDSGRAATVLDNAKGYFGLKKIPGRTGFLIAANYHGFSIIEKTAAGWKLRNQIEGFSISSSKFTTDGIDVWLKVNDACKLELSKDLKRFSKVTNYKSPDKSLNGVTSIQQLNGKIYLQTENRFFTYNKTGDTFTEDKKMSQLFSRLPPIRYCFEDNSGNISYYFGESMGILMKLPDGAYKDVRSPFLSLTGNMVYFFESENAINNNNIFIGITEGLVHYNPDMPTGKPVRPVAFVTSFSFANDTLITANMRTVKDIRISFKHNTVKFSFSSPIYDNPESVRFSYKLEGFDTKWSSWSRASVKEYTNLQEGDYIMQVRVMDGYGETSDAAGVAFTILPPFYRHPLAYISYMLIMGLAIYLTRRRIKNKIKQNLYYEALEQQKLYLERETKIREEQLELEKEIERLKNEQLHLKLLTKDRELVDNTLQVVKKDKVLNNIMSKIKNIDSETPNETAKATITKLSKTLDKQLNTSKSWQDLEKHIRNVHFDFLKRLKDKHPDITPREMDLATYLLMNMSSKEIAEMMNISEGGTELARHRLRKKLGLTRKENLIGFLMSI